MIMYLTQRIVNSFMMQLENLLLKIEQATSI